VVRNAETKCADYPSGDLLGGDLKLVFVRQHLPYKRQQAVEVVSAHGIHVDLEDR